MSEVTLPKSEPAPVRAKVRRSVMIRGGLTLSLLTAALTSPLIGLDAVTVDPFARAQPPSAQAWFGTDLLGRDLLARTVSALAVSAQIGVIAATLSTLIALILGLAATFSRAADRVVGIITELGLGLPHFVLVLMVAYAAGGGMTGVILGVSLTHWPRLCRVLRHEAQTVATAEYVRTSLALGRSRAWIGCHHMAPHLLPQLLVGFVLIFPHAILHEAGVSFVGLGIEPHLPSIGVMLADSLRGLMAGHWWVALFPGMGLVGLALAFETLGEALRRATDPREGVA